MMDSKLMVFLVGAGFLTGGSLAIRGGYKAARNSAIGCAILLAVIEGVGIGIQRVMAENTRLDVRKFLSSFSSECVLLTEETATGTSAGCKSAISSSGLTESDGCIKIYSSVRKILHSAISGNLAILSISEGVCALHTGKFIWGSVLYAEYGWGMDQRGCPRKNTG